MATPIDGLKKNLVQVLPQMASEVDAKIVACEEQLTELRSAQTWIRSIAGTACVDLSPDRPALALDTGDGKAGQVAA